MIIRAADDLGAIYALLHLSRTALGVTPFWFWNDQQFERKELAAVTQEHIASKAASVALRGWSFEGGQLLEGWNLPETPTLGWEMAFEALLRCGGNFVCLPQGKPAALAEAMGLWRMQDGACPLDAAPFDRAVPGKSSLYADSADDYARLWAEAVDRHKQEKIIWRIGLPARGGDILDGRELAAATLPRRGAQIGRVLRAQYDAVRAQLPTAPICLMDSDCAALERAGALSLPDDIIRIWQDNGYGKFVSVRQGSRDPRTPQLPPEPGPGRGGVYFHAAYSDGEAGNCLTMRPAAMDLAARELCDAFEKGARAMWLIGAGSVKPHVYPLDALAALWRNVDADLNAHRTGYLRTYYRAPDGWALQNRQLDDLDTCLKSWFEATAAFGPWPDQRAGEQFMAVAARAVATAWLSGRTRSSVPELRWAAGDEPFAEQLDWLRGVCADALPGFDTLVSGCEYAARPTTRLWADTVLGQAKLYRYCLGAVVDLCDGWQRWTAGEYRACFLKVGRAAAGFEAARRVVRDFAHGRWANFYRQEETLTDLARTVWVLSGLTALPRAAGDGPDYTGWQKEALGDDAPASAMRDEALLAILERADAQKRAITRQDEGSARALTLPHTEGDGFRRPEIRPRAGGKVFMSVSFDSIRQNTEIAAYIRKADESLIALGYTEHSFAHVGRVADTGRRILLWPGLGRAHGRAGRASPAICTTSATWSTASTTPRAARSWPSASWTSMGMDPADDRHRRHRHRQPRRGHRLPGERRGRGPDPGGQDRRAPQPRPQPGHVHLRHPRPGQLLGQEVRAEYQLEHGGSSGWR